MAKYDVVQKVNGNILVVSTWENNKNSAKQAFYHQCELLCADSETTSAIVAVFDDNLDIVDGLKAYINKE